jgi:hypothetical protein
MASYASVLATPVQDVSIDSILELLRTVTAPPDNLRMMIDSLRKDMETPAGSQPSGFRSFAASPADGRGSSWRSSKPTYTSRPAAPAPAPTTGPRIRYQSQFKASAPDTMNDKILTSIIGNKLNSFTPVTYNDTRDFIYQIIDSGETAFIKDFVEKVFTKATREELYCALFAKLIAEIAHKFPVIYEEMNVYHTKFMSIFEDVEDHKESEYDVQVKKKQYRMGYGHFISELAGQNALPKERLFQMIDTICQKLVQHVEDSGKIKTLEEFIDCLFRLTKNLRDKSPAFFSKVKANLLDILNPPLTFILAEKRPGLSTKARFGLLDLKDLFV